MRLEKKSTGRFRKALSVARGLRDGRDAEPNLGANVSDLCTCRYCTQANPDSVFDARRARPEYQEANAPRAASKDPMKPSRIFCDGEYSSTCIRVRWRVRGPRGIRQQGQEERAIECL